MSDNKPPKLIQSDPVHSKYGGKYPKKALWMQNLMQKKIEEELSNSPETDVSTIETNSEASTATSKNVSRQSSLSLSQRESQTFPMPSSFNLDSQPDSQFAKDVPDSFHLNSQLDFLPEPKKDNTPEPNDGELPKINQPREFADELDDRTRVADYEEEDEDEEMDELEAYNFIKENPAFFEYEIKELIVRHYERTCIYSIAAMDRMTQNQKIRYIKTHHPEWYSAAYEAALRDMSIKRNNHPTRW